MQVKETIKAQIEAVVSSVAETGNRAWITPTFERLPLKDALSSGKGDGVDNVYYS